MRRTVEVQPVSHMIHEVPATESYKRGNGDAERGTSGLCCRVPSVTPCFHLLFFPVLSIDLADLGPGKGDGGGLLSNTDSLLQNTNVNQGE